MSKSKSVFLDIIRLLAALVVVYSHCMDFFYANHDKSASRLYNMAHFAVVIFFVLSGYVIGYTTKINNRGPVQYAIARLSRLASMVIPALTFTFIIEISLSFINPEFLEEFQRGPSTPRYFISAFFLNELWFFSSAPPLNGPLWSVSFEFFYYFIFGVYFFSKGFKNKIICTGIVCFIAGPKIIATFPIWLAGYYAYTKSDYESKAKNILVFVIAIAATYACYLFIPPIPHEIGHKPFYMANQFLTDWAVGLIFAFSLWAFPMKEFANIPIIWVKKIRRMADFTFPIYVLHYPSLLFCKGVLMDRMSINYQIFISLSFTLFISIVLGATFEHYRSKWTMLFSNIFAKNKILKIVK